MKDETNKLLDISFVDVNTVVQTGTSTNLFCTILVIEKNY